MQRLLEDHAVRDVDVRAVGGERRVQRGERARPEIGELPEVTLDDVGLLGDRRGERSHADALRQVRGARQLGRQPAVHDDDADRRVAVEIAGELRFGGVRGVGAGRPELGGGDWRDAREAPFLVTRGREPERGEPRGGAVAQILEPPRAALRPLLDRGQPWLKFFRYGCHRAHAPTGAAPASIQP